MIKIKPIDWKLSKMPLNSQIELIFTLLVIYQLKHFIADFPLQREYMLRKGIETWDFLLPLSLHCGVHAFGSLMITLWFAPSLWYLAILDFVVHFFVDRVKASPSYLGRFNDLSQASFWNILGLDQMAHHLTHIYIIWCIVGTHL